MYSFRLCILLFYRECHSIISRNVISFQQDNRKNMVLSIVNIKEDEQWCDAATPNLISFLLKQYYYSNNIYFLFYMNGHTFNMR